MNLIHFPRNQNPFNPEHAIFKNNYMYKAAHRVIYDRNGVIAKRQAVCLLIGTN